MPKLLVSTSVGTQDHTRATIPFHIVVNGALKTGTDCAIVLMGDATELMKKDVAATVRGVGVPVLSDLLASLDQQKARYYV